MPQWAHGASEYGISREHLPQIIRVAHTPIAAAGQSDASWHTAHGYARAQHGKRSQRCKLRGCKPSVKRSGSALVVLTAPPIG